MSQRQRSVLASILLQLCDSPTVIHSLLVERLEVTITPYSCLNQDVYFFVARFTMPQCTSFLSIGPTFKT